MTSKLYVGNLPFQTEPADLENLFSSHGSVQSVNLIKDRDTGRMRGFGFVEMATSDEAQEVISNLDQKDFNGRTLKISLAKEKR